MELIYTLNICDHTIKVIELWGWGGATGIIIIVGWLLVLIIILLFF